jgi:hypothetical protein
MSHWAIFLRLSPGIRDLSRFADPDTILFIAAPIKVLFLVVAAVYAARSASSFQRESSSDRVVLLGFGMWAYVVAQSVLAFYQLVLGRPAPFPSIADLFFAPATVLLAVSLVLFLKVYKSVGFEVGETFDVGSLLFFVLSSRGVLPRGRAAGSRLERPRSGPSTLSIPCSTAFS